MESSLNVLSVITFNADFSSFIVISNSNDCDDDDEDNIKILTLTNCQVIKITQKEESSVIVYGQQEIFISIPLLSKISTQFSRGKHRT